MKELMGVRDKRSRTKLILQPSDLVYGAKPERDRCLLLTAIVIVYRHHSLISYCSK